MSVPPTTVNSLYVLGYGVVSFSEPVPVAAGAWVQVVPSKIVGATPSKKSSVKRFLLFRRAQGGSPSEWLDATSFNQDESTNVSASTCSIGGSREGAARELPSPLPPPSLPQLRSSGSDRAASDHLTNPIYHCLFSYGSSSNKRSANLLLPCLRQRRLRHHPTSPRPPLQRLRRTAIKLQDQRHLAHV